MERRFRGFGAGAGKIVAGPFAQIHRLAGRITIDVAVIDPLKVICPPAPCALVPEFGLMVLAAVAWKATPESSAPMRMVIKRGCFFIIYLIVNEYIFHHR